MINLDFFNKLSKKEKFGIVISAVIISLALIDRVIVIPIKDKLERLDREVIIMEKKLAGDLRNINQKELILTQYNNYSKYIKKAGSDEEEVAKVLAQVESLARQSGVALINVKPQAFLAKENYKQFQVEIEAEAGMEALVKFLYGLNTSTQLLRADSLRFAVKEKDASRLRAIIGITKLVVSENEKQG